MIGFSLTAMPIELRYSFERPVEEELEGKRVDCRKIAKDLVYLCQRYLLCLVL
jgi:hypothetical protein